jgi:hypothetical protein
MSVRLCGLPQLTAPIMARRAACHEGIAAHVERAGLVIAFGAAERVDRLADHHVSETAVLQHLLPARTGQPAGYSTGPQVDVAQRPGWHLVSRSIQHAAPRIIGAVNQVHNRAAQLVGSYELLVWLIRTSGAVERGPLAEHFCSRAACRAAIRALPLSAVDGNRPGGSERHASGPTPRPAGQAARLPTIPTNEQRDDGAPEASAVDEAAVAAYLLSVQAGNPLSERWLAQMFGRTSRRWARARIADARHAPPLQDLPDTAVTT